MASAQRHTDISYVATCFARAPNPRHIESIDISFRSIIMGEYAAKQIFRFVGRQTGEGESDVALPGRVRSV